MHQHHVNAYTLYILESLDMCMLFTYLFEYVFMVCIHTFVSMLSMFMGFASSVFHHVSLCNGRVVATMLGPTQSEE